VVKILLVYDGEEAGTMLLGSKQGGFVSPVGGARKRLLPRPSWRGGEALWHEKLMIKSPCLSKLAQTPFVPSIYWPCPSDKTSVGVPGGVENCWVVFTVTLSETTGRTGAAKVVNAVEQARNRTRVMLRMWFLLVKPSRFGWIY